MGEKKKKKFGVVVGGTTGTTCKWRTIFIHTDTHYRYKYRYEYEYTHICIKGLRHRG